MLNHISASLIQGTKLILISLKIRLGSDPKLEDMMWASLTDALSKTPMGVTAENLAEKYNLTRQEVDEFALSSQKKWGEANQAGNFVDEIAPMEIKSKKVCVKKLFVFIKVLNIST